MASPRTLLGPLTTPWSAPPICSIAMGLGEASTTVWQGQTCNPALMAHDWTDCWPPRTAGAAGPARAGIMLGWGLYSPGLVCPAGYTTAALATAGGSSGWPVQFSMIGDETAAACCPSGFSVAPVVAAGTIAQTCVAVATSSSFSTVQCASGSFADFALVTVPNPSRSTYTIYAPLFQLNFRPSDLPSQTSSGPPTSSTPDPGAGGIEGLSLGAKVGIGVGLAVAAAALAALAFLAFRALRRRRDAHWPRVGEALTDELGGMEVRELEALSKPQELDGSLPRTG